MVDYLAAFNIGLTFLGILVLLFSIILLEYFKDVLEINDYGIRQWQFVRLLIIFFVVAFLLHLISLTGIIEIPIDPTTLVTLVYFFGAIFVVVTMNSIKSMTNTVLGEKMSDIDAVALFLMNYEVDENQLPHLHDDFAIFCESCQKSISYSLADVVRSNARLLERGIGIMNTFGVRSFILRPTHKCETGRRETTVIHDDDLAYRAVDHSRLLIGEDL